MKLAEKYKKWLPEGYTPVVKTNGDKSIKLSPADEEAISEGVARIDWGGPLEYPVVVYDPIRASAYYAARKQLENAERAEYYRDQEYAATLPYSDVEDVFEMEESNG